MVKRDYVITRLATRDFAGRVAGRFQDVACPTTFEPEQLPETLFEGQAMPSRFFGLFPLGLEGRQRFTNLGMELQLVLSEFIDMRLERALQPGQA